MKKIFAFLLLGLTVAFASCGDEKTETGTDWFLTPVAEVNGTTVGLSCQTRFGEGVLENTSVGFSYAAVVDNKIGAFADVAGSAVDGTGIAATLTGLQPETSYVVFAYAGLSTGRVQSAGAVFKTGQDDMPDPDPERPAFGTPAASGVTKTEATLNCTFNFEDTQPHEFSGEVLDVLVGVVAPDAEQHQQSRPDPGADIAADSDGSVFYTLNEQSHGRDIQRFSK